MTFEEAKEVFLYRGYVEVEGALIYDADKWRESCRVISEWLEQEPCDDCIARQPLIDKWNSCADMLMGKGDSEIIMNWIFDAPSVTPTQKWTPVSEEPPKEDGEYLCTVEDGEEGFPNYLRLYDYYATTHKFDTEDYEYDGKVIAWMPVPKIYKTEKEE